MLGAFATVCFVPIAAAKKDTAKPASKPAPGKPSADAPAVNTPVVEGPGGDKTVAQPEAPAPKPPRAPKRMTAARLASVGDDETSEVIVQLEAGVSHKAGPALVKRFHGDVVRELPIINAFGVMLKGDDMRRLRRHPHVRALSPNAQTKATAYDTIATRST